jgi:hypothetical protein
VLSDGKVLDIAALELARREAGLSLGDLWLRYFALGGNASPTELEAYLTGDGTPHPHDYDLVAHALNESLWELGRPSEAPYAEDA